MVAERGSLWRRLFLETALRGAKTSPEISYKERQRLIPQEKNQPPRSCTEARGARVVNEQHERTNSKRHKLINMLGEGLTDPSLRDSSFSKETQKRNTEQPSHLSCVVDQRHQRRSPPTPLPTLTLTAQFKLNRHQTKADVPLPSPGMEDQAILRGDRLDCGV